MSVMENPQPRPRSKSTFSFKSDKSHSSKASGKHKEHLKETHAEKARLHLGETTKANPNAAITEHEPVARQLEATTMGSLRSIRPVDIYGNPIAEPDLSNPTRPRWERPLDTIRSFEAAIDGEYKRRQSMFRADSAPDASNGYTSRRSSYYGWSDNYHNSRHSQVGGYYGGRSVGPHDSYGEGYGPPMQGPSRTRYSQRYQSDGAIPRFGGNQHGNGQYDNGVYPRPGYQQSRDTVSTGVSNGSQSEPWANSTDPSSENSSIERRTPSSKADLGEQYGFSGFGGAPQFHSPIEEEHGNDIHPGFGQPNRLNRPAANNYFQANQSGAPPPVPAPVSAQTRTPIKLGAPAQSSTNGNVPPSAKANTLQKNNSTKRKSWFKRRFSKD